MTRPLVRAGLTGGIASGKSTVARILEELGAFVVDADGLAHEMLEPGTAVHAAVVARFGSAILDGAGRIVRPTLGRIVFHDTAARQALEALVHPAVLAEAERRIAMYAATGTGRVSVFEAALLVESGGWRNFDAVIVVRCRRETQIRRLLAREGLTVEEAELRIDAQAPLEAKLAVADHVIDTDGTLHETRLATEQVYARL